MYQKCLVFIPVISQTYCDSKSFAWQYEFCAFNKLAKEDKYGRDIRLTGGNVASRILPVKIHNLDTDDKMLLENELGGVLRSIEFIYKASGVNRPLKPNDERTENLNHTFYRDQINKVANAVKEIITAIIKYNQKKGVDSKEVSNAQPVPKKNLKTKIIAGSFLVLALIVLGYFLIPKLFGTSDPEVTSIAVLPFENLTNNKDNDWLGAKIRTNISMQLSDIEGLSSRNVPPNFKYTDTTRTIPQNVGVIFYILGEYQEAEKYFKSAINISPTNVDPYWKGICMDMKWKGNAIKGREILGEAFQFKELINRPGLVESKVLMDIYDGNYESALSYLSSKNINAIQPPEYYNLKSLLYARIYNLMNIPDKANVYYDSARIAIETRLLKPPDEARLHSALGIAYAGLGQKGKANVTE